MFDDTIVFNHHAFELLSALEYAFCHNFVLKWGIGKWKESIVFKNHLKPNF